MSLRLATSLCVRALGAVASKLGRRYVLVDNNPEAIEVMRSRLASPGDLLSSEVSFVDFAAARAAETA